MDVDVKFEGPDLQKEYEKQLFGQDIYKYSYKLPLIVINNDEKDLHYNKLFKSYLETTLQLFTNIAMELPDLFEDIYKIYEVKSQENNTNNYIYNFSINSLAQIYYGTKQAKELCGKLEIDNKSIIKGDEYCFIVLALNNVFGMYSFIYELFLNKRYPNQKTLETMMERLSFILSPEFQSLRLSFKAIQCLENLSSKETFH